MKTNKVIWKEIDESGVFKTPYSPTEMISASATLQCHIGFGNDLDGHFDSVVDAMQEHAKNYHAEQLRIKIEPTDEDIRNEAIRVKSQISLFHFDQASFQMGAELARDNKIPIK